MEGSLSCGLQTSVNCLSSLSSNLSGFGILSLFHERLGSGVERFPSGLSSCRVSLAASWERAGVASTIQRESIQMTLRSSEYNLLSESACACTIRVYGPLAMSGRLSEFDSCGNGV